MSASDVLNEFRQNRKFLNNLRENHATERLANMWKILDSKDETRQIIKKVQEDYPVILGRIKNRQATKAGSEGEIYVVGLYVMELCNNSNEYLTSIAKQLGLVSTRGAKTSQSYVDDAMDGYVHHALDFIDGELNRMENKEKKAILNRSDVVANHGRIPDRETKKYLTLWERVRQFLISKGYNANDFTLNVGEEIPGLPSILVENDRDGNILMVELKTSDTPQSFKEAKFTLDGFQHADKSTPAYIVVWSDNNYGFEIYFVSGNSKPTIILHDAFPSYEDINLKNLDKKLSLFDFRIGIDIEGSEICDKVLAIAERLVGLERYVAHESYANLELKSFNSVVAQLHRYGEYEREIALVIVGVNKGVKQKEPQLNELIIKGEIAELSGYKKGPPKEIAWLKGNHPEIGAREKSSVYVVKPGILKNPDAQIAVKELLILAKEYVQERVNDSEPKKPKVEIEAELFKENYLLLAKTSKTILDASIKMAKNKWGDTGVCTTSYLMFKMAEYGEFTLTQFNTARFFREMIEESSSFETFAAMREEYFEDIKEKGARYPLQFVQTKYGNISKSIAHTLELAAMFAIETTKKSTIHVRHLFIAMLSNDGVRDKLKYLGLTLEEILEGFSEHLKRFKDDKQAWESILQKIKRKPEVASGEISQGIAGVSNDNDDDGPMVDRLGIEGDVNAFSAVIAAKGTEPPLSIGLFGDWGSGKSFFMGKMRQRIKAIADESKECAKNDEKSDFCKDIVQIPFNAWHYMDANLWASLVTHIFDKLAEHLAGGKKQAVEEKKELIQKVKSAQEMLEIAKEEEGKANAALETARGELATGKKEVAKKRNSVSQLTPRAMAELVMKNPKVSAKIKGACEMVGIENLPETIDDLEKTINDVRSTIKRAGRFWNSLGQSKGQKAVWALLLIVITAIPAGIAWLLSTGFSGELQRWGTVIVGGIVGVVSWIRPKLKSINTGFGELEAARDAAYSEMDKSYNKETEKLREEVVVAERAYDAVREKVEQAEERLSRATKDREDIETGKRLHDYIMERSNDSKYKNKLGIVSMIREDFKGLSELVIESLNDDTHGEKRKIDRIVLYIDDLDRCPSDRVVEVLQAIHLILAFKLFVVVVGVDCRWILHALREEYSAFGGIDGNFEMSGERWLTTPHNYVEKIFQIPFALEQMDNDGYKGLVSSLTEVTEQVESEPPQGPESEPPQGSESEPPQGSESEPPQGPESEPPQGPESEPPQSNLITSQLNMTPDELHMEEWEIEFMKELGDFVSSPRATKRFVNIYMLICATLTDRGKLAKFKGTKDRGGDYQAVQLMLGILTGFPNQACDVLNAMNDKAGKEKNIREFVKKLKTRKVPKSKPAVYRNIVKKEISETEHDTWDRLHDMLEGKIAKLGDNTSFEPFGEWAGFVGRFSFQHGRTSEHRIDESNADFFETTRPGEN